MIDLTYHASHGEDKWIVEHLPVPSRGVYVDVGAFDGVNGSNTFHFEQRGWTGLAVECDPRSLDALRQNRKCDIATDALDRVAGTRAFTQTAEPSHAGFLRTDGPTVQVQCTTLAEVCRQHGIGHIDVLSIDTEGTELDVWAGRGHLRPSVVILEWFTYLVGDRKDDIRRQMAADGYREVAEFPWNLIFVPA